MEKLKFVLKTKGITQKQLASMIGMTEVGVSKIVNGTTTPKTLQKIADALAVPIEDLQEEVHYAKFSSGDTPLRLGALEIPCYVLENGVRVFSGRGIQKALNGDIALSGTWLSKFVNRDEISCNLLPEKLEQFNNPMVFIRNTASGSQTDTYAYEVTLLIDLCNAIIDAKLTPGNHISDNLFNAANTIVRAVAKVGIIALVDEATGYNKAKNRAKDELQKFLQTFLTEEAARWVKTFDDDFFEALYKMRGWNWTGTSKRPACVGIMINDIVYERLAPTLLQELNERNPKDDNGVRKHKHHQYLTPEVGHPKLREHLASVKTIAIMSKYNWVRFMQNLDMIHPKKYQQQSVIFDDEFDD